MVETTKSSMPVSGRVSSPLPEVVVGRLVGIDQSGVPLVDYPGNPASVALAALCTARIGPDAVGRNAALLFADGNPERPLIIGLIHSPLDDLVEAVQSKDRSSEAPKFDIQADGKRVVLEAKKEIVLKSGKASITLTRAGKILLRGAYLLSRSSGVNRIKGGSVQIN